MNTGWHIVSEDGNPLVEGLFLAIVIYPEWDGGKDTGKRHACIDVRAFMDAKEAEGWIMDDQPEEGLVWTEQTGSIKGESVYAWLELDRDDMPELPEEVTWQQ